MSSLFQFFMSERQANARGWAAYAGILLTLLSGLVIGSMRVGEVIHEVKAIREQLTADRMETKQALKELSVGHRDLEKRVEVLEVHDSRHYKGYKEAQ